MKRCYFCDTGTSDVVSTATFVTHITCDMCSVPDRKVQTHFLDRKPLYATIEIQTDKSNWAFTLWLQANSTSLQGPNVDLEMQGFPIHPWNAIQKLKMYLLFL